MIDIIPGRLFLEKDIQLIESGPYRSGGKQYFAVHISLYGREKPVIALYNTEIEMASVVSEIQKAWTQGVAAPQADHSIAEEIGILQERIEETERQLLLWREEQQRAAEGYTRQRNKKPKKKTPKQTKEQKPFVPPTDEEIIAYIKEKKIDEKLGIAAETIAESFRDVYEKNEPTGETDGAGRPVYKCKWKKANGEPVLDWKGCLRTFKARQLMWSGERSAGKKPKANQFTSGVENNDYDFDALEKELANSPDAT